MIETGAARDPHQIACLVGYGATAVYPYLAYQAILDMIATGGIQADPVDALRNYRKGINKGLLKVLSKMGISTIASYRGAQLFEIVGMHDEVVNLCLRGTVSRVSGAHFSDFETDQKNWPVWRSTRCARLPGRPAQVRPRRGIPRL